MPRPVKRRKVCCLPETDLFGPLNSRGSENDVIVMTVEEYETIRLIDHEGLMQEECAQSMNVARTTVQRIYNDARKKIADAIVNGLVIKIEGGNYKLCDDAVANQRAGCGRCRRHRQSIG
ncbi:DUF134 domain-containing protein [Eubacteriaceae bacterium ES2]|nr:DUF134 domain-containing protein [Eubacteriaceae bacterium ES2]